MTVIASFLMMFVAFVALASTMAKHQDQLGSKQFSAQQIQLWQIAGWGLLGLSLWPCLLRWNTSIALAAWFGLLTLAALALGLMFTYTPRLIQYLKAAITAINAVRVKPKSSAQIPG